MGRWTTEDDATLRAMWALGNSASKIAKVLEGRTRNAVIGRVHRLGIAQAGARPYNTAIRDERRLQTERRRQSEQLRQKLMAAEKKRRRLLPPVLEPEPFTKCPPPDVEPAKVYSLMDVPDDGCRWFYGDPKQAREGFCGCVKAAGLPYCENHARRAYQAPVPQPRRPVVTRVRIPTFYDLEKEDV